MKPKDLLERTITDMNVQISVNVRNFNKYGTTEYWKYQEQQLNYEIKDIEEFIRDHRSRDHYDLFVHKDYIMRCKFCGYEYPDGYNGILDCCDKALDAQQEEIGYLVNKEES